MEKIRSFIAIELPDNVKQEISGLIGALKKRKKYPVKWVEPDGIHLTLKFLGDIEPGSVNDITAALRELTADISPFRLEIKGLGVFPGPERTRVAWAGLDGDTARLVRLQMDIESCMEKLGFPRERRRFNPHLTLARVKDGAAGEERQEFGSLITRTDFTGGIIRVDCVHLVKSTLTPQGALYSILASVPLNEIL